VSDPRAKAERSAAKDVRQGVKPQRERAQGSKKNKKVDKPFELWYRWPLWLQFDGQEWAMLRRFKTRKEAEQYIDKECRGWRHPNEDMRTQYRIEGPDE
jgi:hypothetical protein